MEPGDFDRIVERALKRIPHRFRKRIENVAIIVEPEASEQQLLRARVSKGGTLLGLYEGRPLPFRSVGESFVLPDRITIFQKPHERMAHNLEHLEQLVLDTLWHEIAHYFGMDEHRVRAAERRRRL